MGRVIHFELFDDQPQQLVDFYRDVFGWAISPWEGPFEYHLVGTGTDDTPGIDGAIAPHGRSERQPVVLTIDVDDLDDAVARATAAGARLLTEKQEVPGVGFHAYLADPGGSVFGVMESVVAQEQVSPPSAGTAAWDDVGEKLRDLGASLSQVVSESAASPQAQRVREEADRAAASVREAGRVAADRARPHVIAALDRVSRELDEFAARLRGTAEQTSETAPLSETGAPPHPSAEESSGGLDAESPFPEEGRPLA